MTAPMPASPAPAAPLFALPATVLRALYAAGELSPVEVIESVLDRVAVVQPQANCFAHLFADEARRSARDSERRLRRGEARGLLDGIPVTVKENVAVAGIPLTLATAALQDAPPAVADGPPAARTREAGGILFGITTMPEFAMLSSGVSTIHGITRNPLDLSRTVGGSSGGASAAAAGGCGPLHGGSDIGGSLRFPAAWTGTSTLKPSWGRLPVDPPYIGRTIGAIARTVADVALYSHVLSGPDARDYTALEHRELDWEGAVADGVRAADEARPWAGLRVALHTDAGCGLDTDPAIIEAVTAAARVFEAAGATVDVLDPFFTPELLHQLDLFFRVRSHTDIQAMSPERRSRILPYILDWIEPAAALTGGDVIRAYGSIQELRRRTVAATGPYNLVLSPVASVLAFPAGQPAPDVTRQMDHLNFAAPYNFSEQPSASINCGFSPTGETIALQLTGRRFDDLGVLRAMAWWEAVRGPERTVDWAALDAREVFQDSSGA